MLYRYVKGPIGPPSQASSRPPAGKTPLPLRIPKHHLIRLKQLLSPVLITLGSLLIANVAWPIISHELLTAPQIRRQPIISPLQSASLIQTIGGPSEPAVTNPPQVLGEDLDYTHAQNWFPTASFKAGTSNYDVPVYQLSIPKLDIEDAKVIVGGRDLSQGLIQFPGTSLPGQLGSPVIFGHSTLRQFYYPGIDNPDRYHSIFSKIMTLKIDDEIFIDYDGIRYTYLVKEKVEVKPEDVFILQQRLNNRELKLITCTPEGTYLRRGVIVAQLADVF
jgi:LPXTG-site transpeptidase (sortase) family protein